MYSLKEVKQLAKQPMPLQLIETKNGINYAPNLKGIDHDQFLGMLYGNVAPEAVQQEPRKAFWDMSTLVFRHANVSENIEQFHSEGYDLTSYHQYAPLKNGLIINSPDLFYYHHNTFGNADKKNNIFAKQLETGINIVTGKQKSNFSDKISSTAKPKFIHLSYGTSFTVEEGHSIAASLEIGDDGKINKLYFINSNKSEYLASAYYYVLPLLYTMKKENLLSDELLNATNRLLDIKNNHDTILTQNDIRKYIVEFDPSLRVQDNNGLCQTFATLNSNLLGLTAEKFGTLGNNESKTGFSAVSKAASSKNFASLLKNVYNIDKNGNIVEVSEKNTDISLANVKQYSVDQVFERCAMACDDNLVTKSLQSNLEYLAECAFGKNIEIKAHISRTEDGVNVVLDLGSRLNDQEKQDISNIITGQGAGSNAAQHNIQDGNDIIEHSNILPLVSLVQNIERCTQKAKTMANNGASKSVVQDSLGIKNNQNIIEYIIATLRSIFTISKQSGIAFTVAPQKAIQTTTVNRHYLKGLASLPKRIKCY
jgi:hypothetical protein